VWITKRRTASGGVRHRVEFQLGGRGSRTRYGGSFKTKAEANVQKSWIAGELAALRVPDLAALREPIPAPTLRAASERWRASRVDVPETTATFHRTALNRALNVLGERRVDSLTTDDIVQLVSVLHAAGKKRDTILKTLQTLAMVLEDAGFKREENPARDRVKVRLPREEKREIDPPTADHVEAVYHTLPTKHRLPLLFLDWSGARVAAIDKTLIGDYDERRARVRLSKAVTKQKRGVWVELHPDLDAAIKATLPPREDRDPQAKLFGESNQNSLRTAIAKACRALAIPAFSPHDLRHRRISLLHLRGMPWARIGEYVGQKDLAVTANTYTHVLADENELDYRTLLVMPHQVEGAPVSVRADWGTERRR
jgi:integrase